MSTTHQSDVFSLYRSQTGAAVGNTNHVNKPTPMPLDRAALAYWLWIYKMQKATYYDNSGLFGSYTLSQTRLLQLWPCTPVVPFFPTLRVTTRPQCVPSRPLLSGLQLSKTVTWTETAWGKAAVKATAAAARPRVLGSRRHHHCPRPPPAPTAPRSQKKKSSSGGGSSSATPVLTKQIFPWMKESRQNAKKGSSGSTAGIEVMMGGVCGCMSVCAWWGWPIVTWFSCA